jgi:hypothetical protein
LRGDEGRAGVLVRRRAGAWSVRAGVSFGGRVASRRGESAVEARMLIML